MINYKLAKQLKDAGFPQKEFGEPCAEHYHKQGEMCYIPTLSELIDACGDDFRSLDYDWDYREWYAKGSNGGIVRGEESPDIAVAKLWLKLNEQKKEI